MILALVTVHYAARHMIQSQVFLVKLKHLQTSWSNDVESLFKTRRTRHFPLNLGKLTANPRELFQAYGKDPANGCLYQSGLCFHRVLAESIGPVPWDEAEKCLLERDSFTPSVSPRYIHFLLV